MDTSSTSNAKKVHEITVTATIDDPAVYDINHLPPGITSIVCPSCGRICFGNLPPRPKIAKISTESDGACSHCQAKFTIRRFPNNSTQIITITSFFTSKIDQSSSVDGLHAALISLGSNLPSTLRLPKIANKISKAQQFYNFSYVDSIQGIGEPDYHPDVYSSKRLISLLYTSLKYSYIFGITCVKLNPRMFFLQFLEQNRGTKIIISVPTSANAIKNLPRSIEDYVIVSIISTFIFAEYLKNLARQGKITVDEINKIISSPCEHLLDLYHKEIKGCIFDNPQSDEIISTKALENCKLCATCKAKLEAISIGTNVITTADKLLNSIRKPTLFKSFLSILSNPLLSFIFGGLIVAFAVNIFTTLVQPYAVQVIYILGTLALVMVFGKYFWDLIESRK